MAGGGKAGNKNAASKKPWNAAIQRALDKRTLKSKRDALDSLAEKLLQLCDEGDLGALRELADRIEGKAVQVVEAQVDASVTVEIVRFADSAS